MKDVLDELFSKMRMDTYSDHKEYVLNISYSMSLYPKFHIFEIALRNKIDSVIKNHLEKDYIKLQTIHTKLQDGITPSIVEIGGFIKVVKNNIILSAHASQFAEMNIGNITNYTDKLYNFLTSSDVTAILQCNWLLDLYNDTSSLKISKHQLNDIIDSYNRSNKANPANEDILSNLSLGFWISLLDHNFIKANNLNESSFFCKVFRRNKLVESEIKTIRENIRYIKYCRNRVFHFEKILKPDNVANTKLENNLLSSIKDLDKSGNLITLLKLVEL